MIVNACRLKDMAHDDKKIQSARNAQATAVLKQGVEESIVIEDRVSRVGVRQQLKDGITLVFGLGERIGNKVEVVRGKLDPAIRLNQLHRVSGPSGISVTFNFV